MNRRFSLLGWHSASGPHSARSRSPSEDGSLHLTLPVALAYDAITKGWATAHPLAGIRLTPGMVMVFGPRSEDELDVVGAIVRTSHGYATNTLGGAD